ncbi:MAG: serine hydrolase, partial [Calditrichia bacterium]
GVHNRVEIIKQEARGYSYIGGEYQKAVDWNMDWAGGAGSLYSTVSDLFYWTEALHHNTVIQPENLKKMLTPVQLNSGELAVANGSRYGYGLFLDSLRSVPEISHSGGLNGFLSFLAYYPDSNLTIAVLTNCYPTTSELSATGISHDIAELYLWKSMSQRISVAVDTTVNTSVFQDYAGSYEYPGGAIMTISTRNGHIFAQLGGQARYEIFPRSDSEFFWKVVDASITFHRDESGKVVFAVHRQNGQEIKAPRMEKQETVKVNTQLLDRYTGTYLLAPGTEVEIRRRGDRLFTQITGQPEFELFPRSETEYFLKVVKADVEFILNDAGEVTALVINQGGARHEAKKVK